MPSVPCQNPQLASHIGTSIATRHTLILSRRLKKRKEQNSTHSGNSYQSKLHQIYKKKHIVEYLKTMGVLPRHLSSAHQQLNELETTNKRVITTVEIPKFVETNIITAVSNNNHHNDQSNGIISHECVYLLTEESNDWTQYNYYSSDSSSADNGTLDNTKCVEGTTQISTLSRVSSDSDEFGEDNDDTDSRNSNTDPNMNDEICNWHKIEDDFLIKYVKKYGRWNHWNLISKKISTYTTSRTEFECQERWNKLKMNFYFDHDAFAHRLKASMMMLDSNDDSHDSNKFNQIKCKNTCNSHNMQRNSKREIQVEEDIDSNHRHSPKKMKLRIEME